MAISHFLEVSFIIKPATRMREECFMCSVEGGREGEGRQKGFLKGAWLDRENAFSLVMGVGGMMTIKSLHLASHGTHDRPERK